MPKLACTICAAPPDVLNAINAALKDGTKLRDLEKRTPFSRATLSRHHRACIPRRTLDNFRRFNPATDRAYVVWPGEPIPDGLRPNDIILRVQYEKIDLKTVGNPRAVAATPENLATFMEMADEENATRANQETKP
jgi:hypothetical protein